MVGIFRPRKRPLTASRPVTILSQPREAPNSAPASAASGRSGIIPLCRPGFPDAVGEHDTAKGLEPAVRIAGDRAIGRGYPRPIMLCRSGAGRGADCYWPAAPLARCSFLTQTMDACSKIGVINCGLRGRKGAKTASAFAKPASPDPGSLVPPDPQSGQAPAMRSNSRRRKA